MNKYIFMVLDQPSGRFYFTKIKANAIISISESNTRTPYNSTGIQRRLNNARVREIASYCQSPDAMFPTPVILSGKSQYFKFYPLHSSFNQSEYEFAGETSAGDISYVELDSGYIEIDSDKIVQDKEYLSIVDGQHRLAGIKASGMQNEFELLVMFIFDTEAYQDAEIFSTINRNQKPVSKSLVYDLYGLSNVPTVEKYVHQLVKAMNEDEVSVLYHRIKMLGYKADISQYRDGSLRQYVSQAALFDELIGFVSNGVSSDNHALREGRELEIVSSETVIFRKYFILNDIYTPQAHLIGFYNAWILKLQSLFEEDSIMFKTVGFIVAMNVFRELYSRLSGNSTFLDNSSMIGDHGVSPSRDDYIYLINSLQQAYMKELNELGINKIDERSISSSRSGAQKVVRKLLG